MSNAIHNRSQQEYEKALNESLQAIRINVQAYLNGNTSGWLGVSTQLFTLLIDRNKNQRAILSRIDTEKCQYLFHPTFNIFTPEMNGKYLLWTGYQTLFNNGEIRFNMFRTTNPPILSLKDWLNQTVQVFGDETQIFQLTIGDLITYPRDKVSGHYDHSVDKVIEYMEEVIIYESGVGSQNLYMKCVIELGRYIYNLAIPTIRYSKYNIRSSLREMSYN